MSYETGPKGAGGKFFAESVCAGLTLRKVHAWLRDMNNEDGGPKARNLDNEGGVMWVFGQKCEDYGTKIRTTNGFTELLGGVYRQNWDQSDFDRSGTNDRNRPPLFDVVNSNVAFTYASWGPAKQFDPIVHEVRGSQTQNLSRQAGGGSATLFVGYTQRAPAAKAAPAAAPATAPVPAASTSTATAPAATSAPASATETTATP